MLLAGLSLGASGLTAWAHDARPLSVALFEITGNVYRVRMHVPPSLDSLNEPRLIWPAGCDLPDVETSGTLSFRGAPLGLNGLVSCDSPLEGQTIRIEYALFNPSLSTVARLVPVEGSPRTSILGPDVAEWTVPRAPTRFEVARDYGAMGVRHIWEGVDHLLFVVGLLLLARTGRRVFLVVSGFTVAHSITLSLSGLKLIDVAVAPTEAAIALSILFLAGELARPGENRLASRYPLLVSSSFGLLHGLGFAAALGEIGLPADEVVTSLLFFNVGVEIGQILFILPFVAAVWLWRSAKLSQYRPRTTVVLAKVNVLAPYGIGGLAAFWFIERLTVFLVRGSHETNDLHLCGRTERNLAGGVGVVAAAGFGA